jgi:glutamate-1-semialdehyde 2,1-aminomutase
MLTLFFQAGPVRNYAEAKASNTQMFGRYWNAMRERGVYLPPSQFEAMFVSLAHTDAEIAEIAEAARDSLAAVFQQ